jgi:hypothetical protein
MFASEQLRRALDFSPRLLWVWLKNENLDIHSKVINSVDCENGLLWLEIQYIDHESQIHYFKFSIRLIDIEDTGSFLHPFLTAECRTAFRVFLSQPFIPTDRINPFNKEKHLLYCE